MIKQIKQFIKKETVLSVAILLSIISSLIVHPDREYVNYIDFRTLAILFSLMTVMAGLKKQGIFDLICKKLLKRTHNMLNLTLVLVGICFFFSMFITNDVALITFVPFTFIVLDNLGDRIKKAYLLPIVCMQTIAANLGSMLTPIGNPQNLYLYSKSQMSIFEFISLMLPYSVASLVLLLIWIFSLCKKKDNEQITSIPDSESTNANRKIVIMDIALFAICLLSVVRILPYAVAFTLVLAAALLFDRQSLKAVDYSLLLTFVAFFVFIGNLGRLPEFSAWLKQILEGHEVMTSVLASQVTSNVPAALLLSGFTDKISLLIIGTNLGGLGTLIASMASLISYRQIACKAPDKKRKYFFIFTISNVIFIAFLLLLWQLL